MKKHYKTEIRQQFYQEMYEKFNGRCQICGNKDRLVVDHDHKSGFIRGLLCYRHNTGLGLFQDSPSLLRAAAEYLENLTPIEIPDKKKKSKFDKTVIVSMILADPDMSLRRIAKAYREAAGCKESTAQSRVWRIANSLKLKELH